MMNYKIKMNKDDYFKISKRIISNNLEIDGEDVYFEVEGGSYQIIKKSNYKYKVIENVQSIIVNFVKKHTFIIIGILFLFSVLYMNLYRVNEINFNRDTPINDEIEYKIKSSFKKLFFFDFCSLDFHELSKELRMQYPEYPYIEVGFNNNIIDVTIYNYDEVLVEYNGYMEGDVVAKKDGIVDVFYVFNGQNMVSKNQYVKSGDVLISGKLVDKYVQASGLIMAITYDKVIVSIPKRKTLTKELLEKDNYYRINIFDYSFDIGKKHKYDQYNMYEEMTFNLFDFFNIKKIEDVKKNDIIVSYSYEEAYQLACDEILLDFENTMVNQLEKVIEMASIKCEEDYFNYNFTFIVKKYESIGMFKSY